MLRIAAGELKGFTIQAPKAIRPTEGLVRQALFNILGELIVGARVVDAFAGSGALGLEALSRGAEQVILIDSDPDCQNALQQTLAKLPSEWSARCHLIRGNALKHVPDLGEEGVRADVILLDPPYRQEVAKKALRLVGASAIMAPSGVVVVEHEHDMVMPPTVPSLAMTKQHRYGQTVLSFYQATHAVT